MKSPEKSARYLIGTKKVGGLFYFGKSICDGLNALSELRVPPLFRRLGMWNDIFDVTQPIDVSKEDLESYVQKN